MNATGFLGQFETYQAEVLLAVENGGLDTVSCHDGGMRRCG